VVSVASSDEVTKRRRTRMRRLLLLFLLIAPFLPARAAKQVAVEQLEHTLADPHGKHDQDLARQLGGMRLSERLSSPRLARAQYSIPKENSSYIVKYCCIGTPNAGPRAIG
jgi:hypothetical protein